jgi:tetratricopeptide (TPR) repeat protein
MKGSLLSDYRSSESNHYPLECPRSALVVNKQIWHNPGMTVVARTRILTFAALLSAQLTILAQPPGASGSDLNRQAVQLDLQGKGAEARVLFQKAIDAASTPASKASAQRAMAMSWGFEGNCKETIRYEQMVIDYWTTKEKEAPRNAYYQQGEMANEAARICIDSGDLDAAEQWYQKGHDLGLKEPEISADRKALWVFRLEHARARIAARRGKQAEADQHVKAAKTALDMMTDLRKQQEVFYPYLTGYVALYLGDYKKAVADLENANQRDPFIQCLLGQAHEKLRNKEKAIEYYRKASSTTAHNPPAAYARPFAQKKLG